MDKYPERFRTMKDSPTVFGEIVIGDESITFPFNWSNTLIRYFTIGSDQYDHIVIELNETFFSLKFDKDFVDKLRDLSFPYRVDPALDEESIDAYINAELANQED